MCGVFGAQRVELRARLIHPVLLATQLELLEQHGKLAGADVGRARLEAVCGATQKLAVAVGHGLLDVGEHAAAAVGVDAEDACRQRRAAVGIELAELRDDGAVLFQQSINRWADVLREDRLEAW